MAKYQHFDDTLPVAFFSQTLYTDLVLGKRESITVPHHAAGELIMDTQYRQEAVDQYGQALKLGQKYYKNCIISGKYPYPQVLDDILVETMTAGRVELGLVAIPMEQIVGTKAKGRRSAFAGNFMPLLEQDTEFAAKWIALCTAHLGDEGIHDPIRCYEYMGRFYVQEGNKRVSVLKSYDAPTIPGYVTRIIPAYAEETAVQAYYEFMRFYQLSGLYQVTFTHPGGYAKLQAALGFESDHVWTMEEQRHFRSGFSRLKEALGKHGGLSPELTPADVLLIWLRVYPFSDLTDKTAAEIKKELESVWPDVGNLTHEKPIAVSTEPPEPEKNIVARLLGTGREKHLDLAFFYTADPEESRWIKAHEQGREFLLKRLGDRISAPTYVCERISAEEVMEQAIADGAQVLFAVTPTLIDACCKIAARHPQTRVFNCSLSMPYPGVRTYYGRAYESKFVAGAIAGAMSADGEIGYVADYPIFGVPASINAFALGARSINPRAQIRLKWSCMDGDPVAELLEQGVTLISRPEGTAPRRHWEWSLYRTEPGGSTTPLASPCWNWGRFYEEVVLGMLSGSWNMAVKEPYQAVNYWWGLNTGIIDVKLSDRLPDGLSRLAQLLRRGISDGNIEPFRCLLVDQEGTVRNKGESGLSPEEIMNMDWLCDCVDGTIPGFDEIRTESRALVRLLGVYRDQIPPEKEATQL